MGRKQRANLRLEIKEEQEKGKSHVNRPCLLGQPERTLENTQMQVWVDLGLTFSAVYVSKFALRRIRI